MICIMTVVFDTYRVYAFWYDYYGAFCGNATCRFGSNVNSSVTKFSDTCTRSMIDRGDSTKSFATNA